MRRIRTNTPLQALATLNDPVSMEAAQKLALRALSEPNKSDKARVGRLFRMALVRPPAADEVKRILALHKASAAELKTQGTAAQKLLHYDKTVYSEDREVPLVADARTKPPSWRYTGQEPAAGWNSAGFDDSAWKSGVGQFGFVEKKDSEPKLATPWESENLWMRIEFDAPAEKFENFRLAARTLSAFEAYLNGAAAASSNIDRAGYYEYPVATPVRPGRNVLAVRATRLREKAVGQIADVGLAATRAADANRAAWVVVANTILNLDEMLTRR